MAYPGRPGVYISERLLPAQISVTGTANAAGAALGQFEKGPEQVTLVTSWSDFAKKFGGYNSAYPSTFEVGQFFLNGGRELYVKRVLNTGTAAAAVDLMPAVGTKVATATALSRGTFGATLRVEVTAPSNGKAHYVNLNVWVENGPATEPTPPTSDDILLESFPNVTFFSSNSSDYAPTVINGVSQYISIGSVTAGDVTPAVYPLTGGSTVTAATASDFTTSLQGNVSVPSFESIDRTLVLFAPGVVNDLTTDADSEAVQVALAAWADTHNGFAFVSTPPGKTTAAALVYSQAVGVHANAAVYYPNILVSDPVGRSSATLRKVAPAGSLAGLTLATDLAFGPFKAPAGYRSSISGAIAPEVNIVASDLDLLNTNTYAVNALRSVPRIGVIPMGARTLLQDGTANRYVSTRRSVIFLRRQLELLSSFALFETNNADLWARVRTSLGVFLNDYRNQGGLAGTTPNDAFYVLCDGSNNTATDIANGVINIEVGVALQFPAEFVVITLSQKSAV